MALINMEYLHPLISFFKICESYLNSTDAMKGELSAVFFFSNKHGIQNDCLPDYKHLFKKHSKQNS